MSSFSLTPDASIPTYKHPSVRSFLVDDASHPMSKRAWRLFLLEQDRWFKRTYNSKSPGYPALLTRHRLGQQLHVERMSLLHAGASPESIAARTAVLNVEHGLLMQEAWASVEFASIRDRIAA